MVDILLDSRKADLLASSELPRNTALVALPAVELSEEKDQNFPTRRVRLAMHTDNMRILLSALASLPELPFLRVEGREMSDHQSDSLMSHSVYRFYMSGRLQRARFSDQQDALVYLFPDDLNLNQQDVGRLADLPFSPSTLSRELGFKTVYFDARELVERWEREGAVNAFLPQLGGVNEFKIGSDSLSQRQLEEIAARIARRFQDEQGVLLNTATVNLNALTKLSNASLYQSLVMFKIPTNDKISFSNTLFSKIIDKGNFNKEDGMSRKILLSNKNESRKKY